MEERQARREGLRLMLGSMRGQSRWVAGGVLAAMAWTAAKVAVPSLAQGAIDQGITPGDMAEVTRWTLAILIVGVVQGIATGSRRFFAFRTSLRAEANLRQRLFAHLQLLHFAYHDRTQTGQLMSRGNSDVRQVQNFLTMIPITIANLLTIVSVVVVLLLTNVRLTVLALASLPLLNVAAARFSTRLHPAVLSLQERLAEVSEVVEETVAGVRVVKGFGTERLQRDRLAAAAERVRDDAMWAARLRANFVPLLDLLPMLGLVAILWFGGHEVLAGNLSVGALVKFSFYVLMLVWPLRMTGMLVAQVSRAMASAARIHEVLDTDPLIVDQREAGPLSDGPGEVRFEGVRFGYEHGAPVVHDLDLTLRGGEAVALVGATGCGKTTVARLIPRFYDVEAGCVRIDGADVREVRLADVRRAVGIVFEDTFLFTDTVRANIAFADPEASFDRIRRAAELAGAHSFIDEMPDGYDTVLGEQGLSLSGGQRQRVAIARAILADPRILVLDDATSSVDPTKEHEIRDALAEVMEGRTTVIIAHRSATIALADRVVLLDAGRVVAEGTHSELLETNARYREVLARAEEEASIGVGETP